MIYKFAFGPGDSYAGQVGYVEASSRAGAMEVAALFGASHVIPSATGFEGLQSARNLIIRGKQDIRVKGRRNINLRGESHTLQCK